MTLRVDDNRYCNRSWSLCLILGPGGGSRMPERDAHNRIHNYLWSSSCSVHFNVPRVVFKITTIARPWYPKKQPCVSAWLLVSSSEVGVPFHYAYMATTRGTRQKVRGDRSCTHVLTWPKHWGTITYARTLTTLRLSIYSHSHYTDEQNKET